MTKIGIVKFQKQPEKGNKVKIYHDDNSVSFGYIEEVVIETALKLDYKTLKKEPYLLEKVTVIRTNERFSLKECDYCLEINRVIFIN